MKPKNNSSTLVESFTHAFNGLSISFITQRNIRIESFALVCVFLFGSLMNITIIDLFISLSTIIVVIVAELLNTSVEFLADFSSNEKYYEEIKLVKDIAASAVSVSVVFCLFMNVVIFTPYIITILQR